MANLLTTHDLDRKLGFPKGRSARLLKRGLLPRVVLPDGTVRFDEDEIDRCIREEWCEPAETAGASR